MGEDQKHIKITVAATGSEFSLSAAELIAQVRDILLDQRRSDIASTTWQALSEDDQRREVDRLTEFSEDLIRGIVQTVATGTFDVIHAKLDNFKIKDGDVTVTAKGIASDGSLLALNSVGVKALKIIVADDTQFDKHREPVPIDADQPAMELGGNEPDADADGDVLNPNTGELTSVGDAAADVIDTTAAIVNAVSDDEQAALDQEARSIGHAFGRGSYDEHQDPDQNPYDDETNEIKRAAWFAGFYERKNEVEPSEGGADAGSAASETLAEPDVSGGAQTSSELEAAADAETDAAFQQGMAERKDDGGRDENPFDGGTASSDAWQQGFDKADKDIAELFNAGAAAASDGKSEKDNPWKAGSFEGVRWLMGFNRWHDQNSAD